MKATANFSVAVAASSAGGADSISPRTLLPTPNDMAVIPPRPASSGPDSSKSAAYVLNMAIMKSASDPPSPHHPNTSNTQPLVANNTINQMKEVDNKGKGGSPRRRRNNGEQTPQSPRPSQTPLNAQTPQNSQTPQNPQIPQNPQTLQNPQTPQNPQIPQNPQTPQNPPAPQNAAQTAQTAQNAQTPQKAQTTQSAQGTPNAQTPQKAQTTQSAQGTPNAQTPQHAKAPKSGKNPQKAKTPQNAKNKQAPLEQPPPGRILVTGYPSYTQPHDILEVFTKFGNVRIDKCNSFSATLTYTTEEQAKQAIQANKRLHIYGHFLCVRPYSAKLKAEEGQLSPEKRELMMNKQKSGILEPEKLDLSGDFLAQLDHIMAAIRLDQEDIIRISSLYQDIELAFQPQWPGCKAIPFGSITTGLGIKTSDADCFVSLPPQYRHPYANHVTRARRLLMQYPLAFADVLAIPRANTPIVKFYHVPTDTHCDLTFKSPLGAQNSRLISYLLQADPRIVPVAVLVKYWAKVHDLSGTGKLTNYALTMLIIFYLQQPPLKFLPGVERLQRDRKDDLIVDYWNTGFSTSVRLSPPPSATSGFSFADILGGFFKYYSVFDFDELVVCPYLGIPIKKEAFVNTMALPDVFDLYKKNVVNNYVMPIRYQTSICIQDPFEQCHNVASSITSRLAQDLRAFFKFAADAFQQEKPNGCAGFLKTILLQRPNLERGKSYPEYRVNLFPKIINTIVSPDWKAVVRNLVKIIFENMMKINLGKVEEKTNPDSRKEKEKYMASITKPVWKRKKYNYLHQNLELQERQGLITEELLEKESKPVSLQFQLCLTFCHDPKSAVIAIRMVGGDLDSYRDFGKFFLTVMQRWFTDLLQPYSIPDCKDVAAKVAETIDRKNAANHVAADSSEEQAPNAKSDQEDETEEKTSVNISLPAAPHIVNGPALTEQCDG